MPPPPSPYWTMLEQKKILYQDNLSYWYVQRVRNIRVRPYLNLLPNEEGHTRKGITLNRVVTLNHSGLFSQLVNWIYTLIELSNSGVL